GCCRPWGGICTNVFGLIGAMRSSEGTPSSASPYKDPVATCVTLRNGWSADTTRVSAGSGWACAALVVATAPAAVIASAANTEVLALSLLRRHLGDGA